MLHTYRNDTAERSIYIYIYISKVNLGLDRGVAGAGACRNWRRGRREEDKSKKSKKSKRERAARASDAAMQPISC